MVTVVPTATLDPSAGVELLSVSDVDVVRPVTLPSACSPVDGTGLPCESVPWPSADQALAPALAVKVQVKSCDAPTAREAMLAGVKLVHLPPPETLTLVSGSLPVLVSVTTIVTRVPAATFAPGGVWLFRVSVVAGWTKIAVADI